MQIAFPIKILLANDSAVNYEALRTWISLEFPKVDWMAPDLQRNWEEFTAHRRASQGRDVSFGLVALVHNQIVGFCAVHFVSDTSHSDKNIGNHWLVDVLVQEDHRHNGVGSQLVDGAVELTRDLLLAGPCKSQQPRLYLETSELRSWYEFLGWKWIKRFAGSCTPYDVMCIDLAP
jgi:GNAT superfamily N-acetyltransferase